MPKMLCATMAQSETKIVCATMAQSEIKIVCATMAQSETKVVCVTMAQSETKIVCAMMAQSGESEDEGYPNNNKSKMSHTGIWKFGQEEVRYLLETFLSMKEQTRKQIIDFYKELAETDELIRMISLRKTNYGEEHIAAKGINHDLSELVIRHEELLMEREQEIYKEIDVLLRREEGLRRFWQCYQSLPIEEYDILTQMYVEKKKMQQVQIENDLSESTIRRRVRKAEKHLKWLYDSNLSNSELMEQSIRMSNSRRENEDGTLG